MCNTKQSEHVTLASRDTLINILETLPDAFFVVDASETIVYANASAQALTDATPEALCGTSFWRCAPRLVSMALYQAVSQTKQSRASTEIQYRAPASQSWLRVQLAPTGGGFTLQFHQLGEALPSRETLCSDEPLAAAALENIADRLVILTPDGIILAINQRTLEDAQVRREEIVGRSLAETPWWSYAPAVQQGLRAAIAQASLGETVSFEARICPQPGNYLDMAMTMTPYRDASQQVEYLICAGRDITERKHAEEKLCTLLDAIPQLVWMTRPDGSGEYCNRRWCDYTTLTPEQTQGDGWLQTIHPDDAQHTLMLWHQALETGEPYEIEHRLRDGQTGEYRWFLARGMPVRDDRGQIVKWVGTSTDIEEQKQAEQQLKASREDLRVLTETVPQMVWTTRPDGQHEYANRRWCDYTGLSVEDMQSDRWAPLSCIHPDDQDGTRTYWQHALDTGAMYEHEERFRQSQTGEYRWFLTRAMPVRDDTGQIVKWFGTSTDIEEQKQAEQQLKASRENFRVLAETVPHLVWTLRSDGRLEYTNQRACDYLGVSPQSMLGEEWRQFAYPDDDERVQAARRYALATGEPYEIEYRLKESHTGAYRWFLARAMPVRDEAGQIVKWFGTSTDIDEQKRTEQALRQSQQRIRALIDSNLIGIVSAEGEEEVTVEANEAFLHMTGYTQADVRSGMLTKERVTPPDQAPLFEHARQEVAERGQCTPFETELVCKDGSRLPVLVGGVLLQGYPRQIISFVLDNSARKELEQRKDDFISMASHELRNPLTALKLHTHLLAKHGLQDSVLTLSQMEAQINTLTRLVEELLDVSKIQAGRLEYRQERVDLDESLHEIADIMQQTHPSHRILVHGVLQTSLLADADRLGQVFTNLLSNAIKYSPEAQTVEMELSASPETITISVRDHGLGIPPEQRDKIFERFYRVPGPKQQAIAGLGMGLYIVAEIVKRHGGSISVDSEVGRGSTFTVTLPKKREA